MMYERCLIALPTLCMWKAVHLNQQELLNLFKSPKNAAFKYTDQDY